MKTNKLLKVLSAATIISTFAVVDYSTTAQNNNKVLLAADTQNPEVEVESVLMHAYENRPSMGNAALVKTTVQKVNNGYKYKVIWQNITFNGQNDGIGGFWVNESKVTLNDVNYPGALNPKEAEFTLSTLESRIPVKVFVNIMDKIMPGQGKQSAVLQIKTDGLEEKLTSKAAESKPVKPAESSANPTTSSQPTTPAKPTETKPAPKHETPKNVKPSNKPTETTTTKPAETPKPAPTTPVETKPILPAQDQAQGQGEEKTVTYFDDVTVSLLNAYESGRSSMGNAALDGITVYKDGSTYHYIVRFHDIKVGTLTDGITRFWVNGTEYPVTSTGGAMNQVQVHFTSGEQLTNIPVSVFVPTMESIMPGAGKKDAILSLDWSNASERQGTAFVDGGQPGSSANGNRALTPKGGRLNNGRLSNTGLETSSSILAGALTLISAVLVGRRKQK